MATTTHATRARKSQRPCRVASEYGVLIPPLPRSCSIVRSVTTPLYITTVCQALRQTLRSRISKANFREYPKGEVRRIPIPRTRVNKGQQKRRAKVVTIAFPLPSHTDKTSSDRYQGFGRYPKLSGTYQWPCSARSAPLYGCVYKPIETVVLCVRSSGPSRARSSATRAFKAALRSFGTLGAGSAEELETLRLSRQGCVEVPLASTDPCLPLSNRTSARICLHLKSPDLIVTINLRVNTRSVKGEELRSVRSRPAWLPSSSRSRYCSSHRVRTRQGPWPPWRTTSPRACQPRC